MRDVMFMTRIKHIQQQRGFTLLEILLAVAAIATLSGVVILAINPAKQLAETRNAERSVDVNTILNATYQYALDNNGQFPSTVTTTQTEICASNATDCTGLIDLSALTLNETYIVSIPVDPTGAEGNGAGYEIAKTANGRLTVVAPDAELEETISVTR